MKTVTIVHHLCSYYSTYRLAALNMCEICIHLCFCLACAYNVLLGFRSQRGLQMSIPALVKSGGKM